MSSEGLKSEGHDVSSSSSSSPQRCSSIQTHCVWTSVPFSPDLWPSDNAVFLVYAAGKKQSPMQVFFLLLLFFYRVSVKSRCFCVCSVHLTFVKRCLLFCFFFCLFVEAFPRLRLLHFSTLRCCSNVTVTFVTERLFTVGVCTRLWPLVFGLYPRTFVSFLLFFSLIHLNVWQKTKQKKKLHLFLLCCLFASRVVVVEQFCPEEILFCWIL